MNPNCIHGDSRYLVTVSQSTVDKRSKTCRFRLRRTLRAFEVRTC